MNPSNNTTVVRERSRSPLIVDGGTGKKMYKKSHYEYSTTSGSAPTNDMSYNTNQLDSLLSDLKHERDASFDLVGMYITIWFTLFKTSTLFLYIKEKDFPLFHFSFLYVLF